MGSDKHAAYVALVKCRKTCHLCNGLINPSEYEGGIFDSDHIGPWSRWQGNLDAQLMVVGQDWGDVGYFQKYKGVEAENNPSNKTIHTLLTSIGIEIGSPSATDGTEPIIFLTNAILCLKDGGLGAPVKSEWFVACGQHYLKPTIEIVRPKVLVSLGEHAYRSIHRLYNLPRTRFRDAVNLKEALVLPNGTQFFATYHCSPRVLARHRNLAQQKADWQRVKDVL
jgi:uracil-DNA glycosylase family 4